MVNIKETVIEIAVIAVGVLVALYFMNYMGYIQHNSGGIKNVKVYDIQSNTTAAVMSMNTNTLPKLGY